MRRFKNIFAFAVLVSGMLFLSGCDKSTGLRSEKKLKQQIQGNWERINFKSDINFESWTFDSGIVSRIISDSTGIHLLDRGSYAVDGTLFGSDRLIITAFTKTVDELNAKWNLLELDDDVLIISTNETNGGGLYTIEFLKKK